MTEWWQVTEKHTEPTQLGSTLYTSRDNWCKMRPNVSEIVLSVGNLTPPDVSDENVNQAEIPEGNKT